MSLAKTMSQVVGSRIVTDPALRAPWEEYLRTNDWNYLSTPSGNGQNIPDTEVGVSYYCLQYQAYHYDAVRLALRSRAGLIATHLSSRWLIVDFGAGPATALLAIASHVSETAGVTLKADYCHVDQLTWMATLAERYVHVDPNIDDSATFQRITNLIDTPSTKALQAADVAIFVLSYVLCQSSVNGQIAASFANYVAQVCKALGNRPAYILMVDANLPNRTKWGEFCATIKRAGLVFTPSEPLPTLACQATFYKPDGVVRGTRPPDPNSVVYDLIRIG